MLGTGGLNARFTGSDTAAAYFNPSLLSRAKNGISVGMLVFSDQIRVTLGPREGLGVDVPTYPDTLRYTRGDLSQPFLPLTLPTEDLYLGCTIEDNPCAARPRQQAGSSGNTRAYALIGLVNRILQEKLVVGLYAIIPTGDYTTAQSFFVDEREQFFTNSLHPELYSDRLTAPSLSIGVASEFVEGFSIGVSATITLLNNADAGVYVPDAGNQNETLLLTTDVGVVAKIAPHVGLSYEPLEGLRLSATAHSPSSFEINTGFSYLLPNGDEQFAVRKSVHDYQPWFIGAGGEYEFPVGALDLGIVAGIKVGLWSNYRDRTDTNPSGDYAWSNTVTPSLGVRLSQDENWRLLADAAYEPSPVPEQTGRTNYVDNNKLSGMIGGEYEFDAGQIRLAFGGSLQGHWFFDRSHDKITPDLADAVTNPLDPNFGDGIDPQLIRDELPDTVEQRLRPGESFAAAEGLQTNNPGYPGYSSDGYMWGAQVHLSIYY